LISNILIKFCNLKFKHFISRNILLNYTWTECEIFSFTLRNDPSPPLYLNNFEIPSATTVKYLGLHLDTKLNWKDHIIKKRTQMDMRHKELYWLLGRKSNLSIDNKLLLYKSIITPIWTYGIEIWVGASKSNIAVIQGCQYNILRALVDAPWYVTNDMIHKDLGIPTVQEVIHEKSIKHRTKLASYSKPLLQPLPRDDVIRRLKRWWPADL
jgi:hypothetical protein